MSRRKDENFMCLFIIQPTTQSTSIFISNAFGYGDTWGLYSEYLLAKEVFPTETLYMICIIQAK